MQTFEPPDGYYLVAPRKGRVSRNADRFCLTPGKVVAPRKGRVSRNYLTF